MPDNPELISRKQRKFILLTLLFSAAAYLLVASYVGLDKISIAVQSIGISGWLLLVGCSMLNYLLRFIRWQMYLSALGHGLHWGLHLLYYLSAFALTATPAKAGETIRSMLLRPHGIPYAHSLACFFAERLLDVIVVASLATLTVLVFHQYQSFVYFSMLGLFALLLFIRSPLPQRLSRYLLNRIPVSRLRRLFEPVPDLLAAVQQFFSWTRLTGGYLIGMLAWGIQGLAFYFILHNLNADISLAVCMGIYAISLLAGAISFIPGGIGSTELAMGLLLASLGVDSSIVVAAPLISRLSTLWFAIFVGLLASSVLTRRQANDSDDHA